MTFLSMILAFLVIGGLVIYMRAGASPKAQAIASNANEPIAQGLNMELIEQRWREIEGMKDQGGAGLKNALLEADKLLDYVMKNKGFAGDTMGDRLKLQGDRFSDLNGIWTAHKLRNQLAHEVEIDIVKPQVDDAISKLKRGIMDLGVRL